MRIDEKTREKFRKWQQSAQLLTGIRHCLLQMEMQNVVKMEAVGKNVVVCQTNIDTERYVLRFVDCSTVVVDDQTGKRKVFQVQNGTIQKCS